MQNEDDSTRIAEITEKAKIISQKEAERATGAILFSHFLACHNYQKPLRKSEIAAIKMPERVVHETAIGIGETPYPNSEPFIAILVQKSLWLMLRNMKPLAFKLEPKTQSIAVKMHEIIIGEFKPNPFILSFPIKSNSLWESLIGRKIVFATIGLGVKKTMPDSHGNSIEYISCDEIQSECAPILIQSDIKSKDRMSYDF